MFNAFTRPALAIVLALSMISIGCTNNELQTDLNLTANLSSSAALAVSGITTLDPTVRASLVASLNALSQAASEGATDLQQGPLTAQEITNLLAKLSSSIITNIPNVPPVVLAAITAAQSVAQIVIGLLQSQQTSAMKSADKKATTAPDAATMTNLKTALAKYKTAVAALQAAK